MLDATHKTIATPRWANVTGAVLDTKTEEPARYIVGVALVADIAIETALLLYTIMLSPVENTPEGTKIFPAADICFPLSDDIKV